MYAVAVPQPETTHDPDRQELVTGLTLPIPHRQQSMTSTQWVYPVEQETFDPRKSQLVTGLTP